VSGTPSHDGVSSPLLLYEGTGDGPRSLFGPARYLSRGEAEALAKRALSFSTADEARVTIQSGVRGNTRYAVNQISTAGDNYNVSVTVLSAFGRRGASVTTNRIDDEGLRAAVQNAERLARLAPEDPERMPELPPQQYQEGQGWSEATASLDPAGRTTAVRQVTEPSRSAELSATGFLQADAGSLAVANSRGLFAYGRQTAASMTTTVRTADGSGSGWAGAAHHDFSRVNAPGLGARAIEKAQRSVRPVAVEPGRYTVVLEPTAVGNLVQLIAFALNARNADEGRSFFTKPGGGNKIGMKVVDERVTLVSDPLDPEAYANTFSADGLPVARTPWIENGVVRNLAYDRFWAEKQGRSPVPLVGSLRMTGGSATIDEMIASTDRGILVTRFWYIRPVDPRTILYTGLTRDGTFLIEKGKITRAVKNLRFNESPIFMLNNLEAMGQPTRVSASEDGSPGFAIVVPPIKVRDFTFTSLSDAV
jgi:predicted Zn-dependent protease